MVIKIIFFLRLVVECFIRVGAAASDFSTC